MIMETVRPRALLRTTAVACAIAAALAGCANQPTTPGAASPGSTPGSATPGAPGTARPGTEVPDLPPAQAKAEAQKLALQAVDQLQGGDETSARLTLGKALALDATNDLAKKMQDQIGADAQKELGATFFRYTVQPADSLSKIAAQYMGDRFRFYILAKYNDMANPSRLAAGQVIKIPGKAPPPGSVPPKAPDATDPTSKPAPDQPAPTPAPPPPKNDYATQMQKGRDLQKAGDLEGAYAAFGEAISNNPGNRDAILQRDAARAALVRSYDREATQAFQRQNLDLAISKWDRILELDPSNQKAKLEREHALDLKKRLNEKFGTK
jgi:tetratricopeptide (TPR) repeat protein